MEHAGDIHLLPDGPDKRTPKATVTDKDFAIIRGLCSICEGREACTFVKPEGGVWHCEEYR